MPILKADYQTGKGHKSIDAKLATNMFARSEALVPRCPPLIMLG